MLLPASRRETSFFSNQRLIEQTISTKMLRISDSSISTVNMTSIAPSPRPKEYPRGRNNPLYSLICLLSKYFITATEKKAGLAAHDLYSTYSRED